LLHYHILVAWKWCLYKHYCPDIGVDCREPWCEIGPLVAECYCTPVMVRWLSCKLSAAVIAVTFAGFVKGILPMLLV
jgi:hypothetical protein